MARASAPTSIDFVWQRPRGEAEWEAGPAPADAVPLESIARESLGDVAERVTVTFRPDGVRWRVQAEAPDLEPRHTLDLTRRVVNALRREGHAAEPGFPGDAHEPPLPVDPVE